MAILPIVDKAKYLGVTLDAKLRWKAHIKKKKQEWTLKFSRMIWLLGGRSTLSLDNRILLYKQILRPTWSYGCQIWGCSRNSNLKILQTVQNKILRKICGARWYERNEDIHRDLGIETVYQYISKIASNYEKRLHAHPNEEALMLLDDAGVTRRLQRRKPRDLTSPCFHKL